MIFLICRSQFWCQNDFNEIITTCYVQIGLKLKVSRIYWNLPHLIFLLCRSPFNIRIVFIKYWPIASPKFVPKSKILRIYWNLASNMIFRDWYFKYTNFDFKVKKRFIKYLPPVRPNLVPKYFQKFIELWHIWYLKYTYFDFSVKNGFYEIFTSCHAKLTSRVKLLWNSCLILQVFRSWLRDLIKVSLNIYYMLCQNWFPSVNSNLDYKIWSNLYEIHSLHLLLSLNHW